MIYPLSANMKILRAQEHFDALKIAITNWVNLPPYRVSTYEYERTQLYVCRVDMELSDSSIPKLLGDFICNLRSSLEHLAWAMANYPPKRRFTKEEIKAICFPVAKTCDSRYEFVRGLFPSAVTGDIDDLQPYKRGAAFPDHPLWQLHELWNIDKHRVIPVSPTSMVLTFPKYDGVEYVGTLRRFYDHLEVTFPLSVARNCPMKFEPEISIDVVFGEDGGLLVTWDRLCEIYDFVRNEAIPRFARFFA